MSAKTWRQHQEEGSLLLGVGGGPLDEHPSADFGDRKTDKESCTSLTARHLGIEKDPLYENLVKIVTDADLKGSSADTLASRIKAMHRQNYMSLEEIIVWAHQGIHSIVQDQKELLTAKTMVASAKVETIPIFKKSHKIGMVRGDNYMISLAARQAGFSAVVHAMSSGRVLVFTNKNANLDMCHVAGALRYYELKAHDKHELADKLPEERFLAHGQIEECPQWCLQIPGNNLLNGSETAPEIPPTKLSPERVLELVCKHMRIQNPA